MIGNWFKIALVSFIFCISSAPVAHAAVECGRDTASGVAFGWCIDRPDQSQNPDVVFFLHGLGGDEHTWVTNERMVAIRKVWSDRGEAAPTVISISFGALYLLTNVQAPSTGHVAYLPLVMNEILPKLEAKIGGVKAARILMGESMGGFNAVQVLFTKPNLFSRVILLCPAIATIGPYTSASDAEAFYKRNTYVDHETAENIRTWTKQEFPAELNWNEHDPLQRARGFRGTLPPVLVNGDGRDSLGFSEGDQQFATILQATGNVEWLPVPTGDHCEETPQTIERLAEFAMHGVLHKR